MKKTNKLLAFLLAFVMLFSLAIVPASAVEFSDVPENYQYYDAIQSLVVRGIINGYAEDNTFRPEATITRAEFCKMVIYALGLSNLVSGTVTDSGFPDVAPTHWAAGNIQMAFKMGIINGFEDGTFRAEENVTYEQAVKMVVCAASDDLANLAMINGGFPNGYLAVAKTAGLVKNITDGVNSAPAKRGTIAKLVDNMIKTDLTGLGEGVLPGESSSQSGGSIGSDGIVEVDGQIVSVYGATILDADDSLRKDQIRLEKKDGTSEVYSVKNLSIKSNIYEYLGKLVTVFYKEDNVSTQVLTSMNLQRKRNEEITINLSDVLGGYSNTEMPFINEEDEDDEISVKSDAIMMYNGRRVDKTLSELLDAYISKIGSVRFLSTNGNSEYDIVFFTVYDSVYVTNVNTTRKEVNGEGGKKYTIDDEDASKLVTVLKDGKAVEAKTIKAGQVISVAESQDKKVIEVRISTKTAEGTVTGAEVNDANKPASKVTVGGKTYTYISGIEPISEAGLNVKMYIDVFDKIVKYELKAANVNYTYAYMLSFSNPKPEAMQNSVSMKVINLNTTKIDENNYYAVADKININGKNYSMPNEFDLALTAIKTAAALYSLPDGSYKLQDGEVYQPIKYALKDGKVSHIQIGKPLGEATEADIKIDASALNTAIKCTTPGITLGGIHHLNSNTKVLVLPSDRSKEENYEIRIGNQSGFMSGTAYNVLFVDENKSGTSAIVIVYGGGSLLKTNKWLKATPGIVIGKGQDVNGNTLKLLTASGTSTYIDETTTYYSQAKIGDIIRVMVDDDNFIEDLEVVMDAEAFYAGDEFIKIPNRAGDYNAFEVDGYDTTSPRIREGEYKEAENAQFAMLAGTAFELKEGTNLLLALDFAGEGKTLNSTDLSNEDKLFNYGISGAKIFVVEFDTAGKVIGNISTTSISAPELDSYTYKYMQEDADKVFVYKSSSKVEMIVVFRAKAANK